MNVKKLLAAVLCLAMVLTLLPAVAVTSKAVDAPDSGFLVFEEQFDYASFSEMKAAGWSFPNARSDLSDVANYYALSNGIITFKYSTSAAYYADFTVSGLNIGAGSMICVEYRLKTTANANYQVRVQSGSTGATLTVGQTDATGNPAFGLGASTSDDFVTHYQYYTVGGATLNDLNLRAASYKVANVEYDYLKVYVVSNAADVLENDNGFTKLSADMTVEGSLTMGENAVLDLNGHSLTATIVSPGTNATIIDSSANKTGKLIVPKDSLVLKSNNPQLPLWAGTGYIFTEPQLGPERAFLAASSADGFTMDFRPGFGQTIRENYLSQGNTGIKMTADLSWTDIYGHAGSYEGGLSGTKIFNEMYATETARGRLQITGAEKYRNISLALTLESCGVKVSFDPIVFNNTYVTTHFAADFETGSISGTESNFNVGKMVSFGGSTIIENDGDKVLNATGTHRITFGQSITVAAGSTLVIEYDLYADAFDYYTIQGGSQNSNLIATNGYPASGSIGSFFSTSSQAENKNLCHSESVHVRMTVDLGNGMWYLYRNGIEYQHGSNATLAASLNGGGSFLLRVQEQTHYFDNLLIYTVTN